MLNWFKRNATDGLHVNISVGFYLSVSDRCDAMPVTVLDCGLLLYCRMLSWLVGLLTPSVPMLSLKEPLIGDDLVYPDFLPMVWWFIETCYPCVRTQI